MTPLMKKHCLILSLCLLAASSAVAGDAPYYVRKDTWQNSIAASQEALLRYEIEQTRRAYAAANSSARMALTGVDVCTRVSSLSKTITSTSF